ncbi:hypothetical protein Ares1_0009 [Vibrio phage Ares1]|nr:hypothetical protein Ares1_0009 [Vibrio phage Ares1]
MSDTYNKVKVILKAGTLHEEVDLLPYMKTTQITAQCYDSNGDPATGNGGDTVGINAAPVGNPSGDSLDPATITLATPTIVKYPDTFLESCSITIGGIPTGVEEVHVTIMQSIH